MDVWGKIYILEESNMSNIWHVKNWFRVGKNISWKLNFYTLFAYLYLLKPTKFRYRQALKKHDFVLSYLRREMKNVIRQYKSYPEITPAKDMPPKRIIWTVWWQGEENAPLLVKVCLNSIRKNANGAELIVITKSNYKQYIEIPDYILEKNKKGYICNAVLSDIARFLLLEKYGGLWLDATIYVASPIPPKYFEYIFFSQHTKPQKETCWVQNNAYHIFVIGSQAKAKLVSFTKTMFLEYWKTHDTAVDYLSTDYFFFLAMQEYPEIKNEINNLPYSSERLYDLESKLNAPYDEIYFDQLKKDCIFSKLDWHKQYREKQDTKKTFFSVISNNYIFSPNTKP